MRSIDVLILMSKTTRTWKEKFGRVIIEAHACGVPVIGSDSGSIPSVIGEGGWVVHEDDSSALAELLDHLANHREEIEAARAKSLLNVERFSEQEIAKNLLIAWISALNVKRHENDLSQGTLCRD
jgi:glycosyltransferase involved in cell wall biosynthesis